MLSQIEVITDNDSKLFDKNWLFQDSVVNRLKIQGLITNIQFTFKEIVVEGVETTVKSPVKENQFLQLVNNSKMISAIKHAIINIGLARAEYALNHKDKEALIAALNESAYKSTIETVYSYYYGTTSNNKIWVRSDVVGSGNDSNFWIEYNPKEHGYGPLGYANLEEEKNFYGIPSLVLQRGTSNEKIYPMKDIIRFPKSEFKIEETSRQVSVRAGRHHPVSSYEITFRPPASGGSTYHVKFLE